MKVLCVIAILMPLASVHADLVYTYEFQTLPAGWSAESPWTFGGSGAVLSIGASGGPPSTASAEIQSDSAPLPLYAGTDSVRVVLNCTYSLTGWYSSGESYATVNARAFLDGVGHTILFDSDYWGWKERDGMLDAAYQITFPASEGQDLTFSFIGSVGAFGAYAHIDWTITSLVVTVYGPTSLDRRSWGRIKALF